MSRLSSAARSPLIAGVVSSVLTMFVMGGGIAFARDLAETAEVAAVNSVNSASIVNGAVKSIDIADGTVTSTDIADGTITAQDIADGSVTGPDLRNGGVTSTDIADGTVRSIDVLNHSVGEDDLAADAVPHWALVNGGPTSFIVSAQGANSLTRYDNSAYSLRIPGVTVANCGSMFSPELFTSGSIPDINFVMNTVGGSGNETYAIVNASRALTENEGFLIVLYC